MVEPFCSDGDLGICMCKQLRNLSEVAFRLVRFAQALGKPAPLLVISKAAQENCSNSCMGGDQFMSAYGPHGLRDPLQDLM
jgi:hypothetical protein